MPEPTSTSIRLTPQRLSLVALALLLAGSAWLVSPSHSQDGAPAVESAVISRQGEPQWFKGNLHTHSLWSDGNDFPEMIVDYYHRNGYDFLALSDHNLLSEGNTWISADKPASRGAIDGLTRYQARFGEDWVETRETADGKLEVRLKPLNEYRPLFEQAGHFILLQSEEITDHFGKYPVHLNATNIRDAIKPQGGDSVRDTIANNVQAVLHQAEREGQPMIPHLNHPNFGYGVSAEDLASVVSERFFEVYNGHPGVHHLGDDKHASVEKLWDIANTLRIAELHAEPLYGLGTDDSHNYFGTRGSSPGRGWVMVQANHLTPESLIRSLVAGNFYASSGVTLASIDYDPKAQTLRVKIQPEPNATYKTQFIGTLAADAKLISMRDPAEDGGPTPAPEGGYPAEIGQVFAEVEGAEAVFQLTGKELYVRAVVNSSLPPENPSYTDQKRQAWTQPVGWAKHLTATTTSGGE